MAGVGPSWSARLMAARLPLRWPVPAQLCCAAHRAVRRRVPSVAHALPPLPLEVRVQLAHEQLPQHPSAARRMLHGGRCKSRCMLHQVVRCMSRGMLHHVVCCMSRCMLHHVVRCMSRCMLHHVARCMLRASGCISMCAQQLRAHGGRCAGRTGSRTASERGRRREGGQEGGRGRRGACEGAHRYVHESEKRPR